MITLEAIPQLDEVKRVLGQLELPIDPLRMLSGLRMMRVFVEGRGALDAHFAAQDFSVGRFSILILLIRAPEARLSPSVIAERVSLTRGTVTGLLDTLEQAGFVKRRPDPEDGRRIVVEITPAGRARAMEMIPAHFAFVSQLLGGFTDDELELVERFLDHLEPALEQLAKEAP